jgi:hypothetical protein
MECCKIAKQPNSCRCFYICLVSLLSSQPDDVDILVSKNSFLNTLYMQWNILINHEIVHIYYFDELGKTGIILSDFHLLEQGYMCVELDDGKLYQIDPSDGNNNMDFEITAFNGKLKDENKITTDSFWSKISYRKIRNIKIHKRKLFFERNSKKWEDEKILTIEMEFWYGDKIFLSNGGFVSKDKILGFTGDLMIYSTRKTGFQYELLEKIKS